MTAVVGNAVVPLADWHGPGWWIVLVPVVWIAFFLLIGLLFRSRWGWGCGWGPPGARFRALDAESLLERRDALRESRE
jgi:hypothetical protein